MPVYQPQAQGNGRKGGTVHACMNAANLENTSSESDVKGRAGGGKWARTKVEEKVGNGDEFML
jgi:hypothetical protein